MPGPNNDPGTQLAAAIMSNPASAASAAPPAGPQGGVEDTGIVQGKEFTEAGIAEFVALSEEFGLKDEGQSEFDDLPAVEPVAPSSAPAPVAPVAPVVPAAPATPVAPAAAPPPVAPTVAPSVAPVAAPVVTGAQPTAPTGATGATAPAAPATPAGVGAEPAPSASEAVPVDPFRVIMEQIKPQEQAFLSALAESEYKIDQQDFEAVLGGDQSKLSLLCARIHLNAVGSVMRTISAQLPVYVSGLLRINQAAEEREQRFWGANPHLDRSKHRGLLPRVLQTYNQLNPGVDEETRYKAVGLLLAQMYNIPLAPAMAAPAAPAAPAIRTPGPVVKVVEPPTYAPSGGGGSLPGAPAGPGNGAGPEGAWSTFVEFARAHDSGQLDQ